VRSGGCRMATLVCGIDPGLALTGYGVIEVEDDTFHVLDAGVCRFDETLPLASRLADVERDVTSVLEEHHPEVVAVEDLYAHYKHPRTAILMGHARGVILLAAAKAGIEVRNYAATRIKRYLTGNGHATKSQVQQAIRTTLNLPRIPEPPDVADALAIAVCCLGDIRSDKTKEFAQ